MSDTGKAWMGALYFVLLVLAVWGTIAIVHSFGQPRLTAQQVFENNCKSSRIPVLGTGDAEYGFPNTTNPDPTKWTCIWPHP
jgi:hypothetical protein